MLYEIGSNRYANTALFGLQLGAYFNLEASLVGGDIDFCERQSLNLALL